MAEVPDNNKETTDGNEQRKKDILRASDIIPSAENNKNRQTTPPADIPKFDLAEQIMAEQRKIIAAKRRGPGTKETLSVKRPAQNSAVPGTPDAGHLTAQICFTCRDGAQARRAGYASRDTDRIIAEIVAMDIAKLCRDNVSRLST